MQGVFVDKSTGSVVCRSVPKPELNGMRGMARVRVTLAGICATDLEVVKGYKNAPTDMILGHEFVGVIDEILPMDQSDSNSNFKPGDRVCAEINCTAPGACSNWIERAQHPKRTALGIFGSNGVFAEFVTVPVENLHLVPSDISDRSAVFAEPLAAACNVLNDLNVVSSGKCAVIGAGKLGSLVAAVLSSFMHDITLLVRSGALSDLQRLQHVQRLTSRSIPLQDMEAQGPNSFDAIVDCSGKPSGLQAALVLVKPRGTIVLKSTYVVGSERMCSLDLSLAAVKEVRIIGNRCGPFPTALQVILNGMVKPENLIASEFSLREAPKAFEVAALPGTLKVLLRP